MALNTGYAAYANNKVMTASPAELTLMLYDGAISPAHASRRKLFLKYLNQSNTEFLFSISHLSYTCISYLRTMRY